MNAIWGAGAGGVARSFGGSDVMSGVGAVMAMSGGGFIMFSLLPPQPTRVQIAPQATAPRTIGLTCQAFLPHKFIFIVLRFYAAELYASDRPLAISSAPVSKHCQSVRKLVA